MARAKIVFDSSFAVYDEWDWIENFPLKPEDFTIGSNKKVWWEHFGEDGQVHRWDTSINHRIGGHGRKGTECPFCVGQKVGYGNDLKTRYPEIASEWHPTKNEFGPEYYTLGSGEKVWWQHIMGDGEVHEWEATINSRVGSGCGCPKCAGVKPFTREKVNQDFEAKGYTLLSPEYVNAHTKLGYICPNGHLGSITYGNFQQGYGCPECAGVKAYTHEKVNQDFEAKGYTLLSPEYVNAHTKLDYICPNGHPGSITYDKFQQGQGCPECAGNKPPTYDEVKQAFDARGYTLISLEYVNSQTKLDYKCPNGHHGSITYGHFQQGRGCPECDNFANGSKGERAWLDSLSVPDIRGVTRQVPIKIGGRCFIVDGFDLETNTVYEFLGNYYHGNPEVFNSEDAHPMIKKSFGQLYQETMERLESIEQAGYNLVYIWEKDFRLNKKEQH